MKKPSRPVTRKKCASCRRMFVPPRADARYCSAACRQQAHRSRAGVGDLNREIEAARLLYWRLLARKAQARGVDLSRVVTDEAQYIDMDGNVFMGAEALTGRGRPAGRTTAHRPGWDAWGLEAAGPPWSPPPPNPPKPPTADQPAPEPTPTKKPRRRKE